MAAASYNTDLTDLVADSSTTSNWAALGGGASGLNIETDYFIEGTRCVSKNAWAGSAKGMIEDTTNTTLSTGSGKAVYTWITHATPGSLGTKAQGGIRILLGSSAAQYNEYYYAGSDTIDYGAPWICAVVDPDNATADSGTVTVPNMDCYGGVANLPTTGPTKGAPFGIDEIRYGSKIEINDGAGAPATFTAMAAANDSINNRWGQFQRTPGSTTNFTQQALIEFGDTTNTTACTFSDSNKNITIVDLEHVASDFQGYAVTQGSTVTLTNINITATAGANTRGNWTTTSATSVTLTSCSFTNMGTFGFSSAYTISGCTFRGTDAITLNGGTLENGAIIETTAVAAVITTPAGMANVTGNQFTSDGSSHAVNLGTVAATTSFDWDNTLSGYVAGTTGSPVSTGTSGNEAILCSVSSGQTLTINVVAGATTPSVKNDGTGAVNVVAGSVTVTGKAVTETGTAISGAALHLEATATTGTLPVDVTVTISNSGTTATVTHTGHGLFTGDKVVIRGASHNQNNGVFVINVTGANAYTYTMASAPGSSPTGTIKSTFVILNGTTNGSGEVTMSRTFSSNQSASGRIRKATGSPLYKQAVLTGTVLSASGGSFTGVMISDE